MTKYNDQERALFEAWRLANFCGGTERLKKCSNAADVYYYTAEQEAWKVWQARAKFPTAGVAVPDGWKLVPVEPTEEMQDAGVPVMPTVDCHPYDAGMVYKAMLAAAPHPVSGEQTIDQHNTAYWQEQYELLRKDYQRSLDERAQYVSGLVEALECIARTGYGIGGQLAELTAAKALAAHRARQVDR